MAKIYDPDVRARAQYLYVVKGYRPKEVCDALGINPATERRWRKAEDWEAKRRVKAMSGVIMADRIQRVINAGLDKCEQEERDPTAGDVDKWLKLQKIADRHNPASQFVAHAYDVIDQLASFVQDQAPDLLEPLTPLLGQFAARLAKDHLGLRT